MLWLSKEWENNYTCHNVIAVNSTFGLWPVMLVPNPTGLFMLLEVSRSLSFHSRDFWRSATTLSSNCALIKQNGKWQPKYLFTYFLKNG